MGNDAIKYYSQYGQDRWLEENIFKGKTEGIFLDIGAHDGVSLSNTLFFEESRDWTGLCIEPIPSVFEKLKQNRKCECIHGAAWAEEGKKSFVVIQGYSEMLSGLKESYSEPHKRRILNELQQYNQQVVEIEVDCITPDYLLNILGGKVDFVSLDTEGSELKILKSINFNKYSIKAIAVENNYSSFEIVDLLKSNNYYLAAKMDVDEIYIKNDQKRI